MKVSCVRVSADILIGKKYDTITNFLAKSFLGIGVFIDDLITTQNNPESILDAIKYSKNNLMFIVGENSSSKNFNIKKTIANHFNLQLAKNERAVDLVSSYYKSQNSPVLYESENEFYLPEGAIPLAHTNTHLQGFILQVNNFTIIFLPDNLPLVKNIFNTTINPLIQSSSQIKYKTIVIKTFGIYEKDIYSILGDTIKNLYKILFVTFPYELEVTILIRHNENLDPEIVRNYVAKIYEKLNKFIYADDDVSLAQTIKALLSIKQQNISIAESFTGGRIISSILKDETNFDFIKESFVCPNIESKINSIGLNRSVVERYGEISIETAYETAAALLEKTKADYVLCTTELQDIKNDKDKKMLYIAVGNEDGIHVYKNTFMGDNETIINNASQTALFYLLKNLKQNNIIYADTTI